ncbi:hypothetical protein RFI_25641 [Reticulomyxa filosa]|uniref:Kelch motif family protein n=1 Tax=Reticulomyxa filosa TaxID=46433 RepID=X6MCW8_RETFI|nr:hypothetical protein RFI_25641 [Reticulomyxa filosa]|eukprot:ETO11734.1 hypothetical protein RFI_25641 [Reticulomyxa filosa]
MGNRTAAQKPPEHLIPFQALKELPTPLYQTQCMLHKYEFLLCGGRNERACYSYHTLKNEYKFICEYPSHVNLWGHCVVKLAGNSNNNKHSNQITLLSFGGSFKHTLVMKYASVWSNISNKLKKSNNCNQWVPFTDNHNNLITIGRDNDDYDDYCGVRAVIGGSNNHLLFITYFPKYISVFDLNEFKFIEYDQLPITTDNYIGYHCFVSNSENGQGQEMMKTNKQDYQMLLFKQNTALSIKYDESNNIFQFHNLHVCKNIASFFHYAYVRVNDAILFFGGWNDKVAAKAIISKSVHKYSIRENKWTTFQNTLPSSLYACVAILSEEGNHIHIIGGQGDRGTIVSTHMKTKVREWDPSQLVIIIHYWIRTLKIKLGWIDDFDKIVIKYMISYLNMALIFVNFLKKLTVMFYHFFLSISKKYSLNIFKISFPFLIHKNITNLFVHKQMEKLSNFIENPNKSLEFNVHIQ